MANMDEKMWHISKSFIDHYGPIFADLSSFNNAITNTIPTILERFGKIEVKDGDNVHRVRFLNPHFQQPIYREFNDNTIHITPKKCVDLGITYSSSLYIDILYEGPEGQKNLYEKKYLCDIPVMVLSNLCNLVPIKHDRKEMARLEEDVIDCGGYFIIDGAKKVLMHHIIWED